LFAQKPVIDSVAYKNWPSLDGARISKNGQYICYDIKNVPAGSKTIVVQATNGKWKKEFKGEALKDGYQTLSDQYFLFITKNDSLGMLRLGTHQIQYVPNTPWFGLYEIKGIEYLSYSYAHHSKDLVFKNLKTGKDHVFSSVDSWSFDQDMLVLIKAVPGGQNRKSINLVDISTGKISKIWEGDKPENLLLDAKHKQLAFKTGDSVWYYKTGSSQPVCILEKNAGNIERGLHLGNLSSFSHDGERIITSLTKKGNSKVRPKEVVEIWSYTDTILKSAQTGESGDQRHLAVIDLMNHHVIRLQNQASEWLYFPKSKDATDNLALIENPTIGDPWSIACKPTWDLVFARSGKKQKLNFLDNIRGPFVQLSPCGKYIIYFDKTQQNYFSYEISTGKIRNLTQGLNVIWSSIDRNDLPGHEIETGRGITSLIWEKNDEAVFVYDRYDVWKLDPLKRTKPVNITNGYGQKNNVIFNYALTSYAENGLDKNEKLYLSAFNLDNKNNGFFLKQLDKSGDPELLHMGPYIYQTNSGYVPDNSDFSPIKAKNSDMYIVRRMSATDAPNYCSTKDFKTFIRLSNLQPQKKYNWYRTELHNWKSLDGRKLQGILYKPENFDPNKKYPIIFYYYERKSDGLNAFLMPDVLGEGSATINIPTYLSHGYLVFSPDIYYQIGNPMQGTYDAVISAANYVSTLPFVNSKKMGLQGCSFGSIQTNYLITHSSLFAAACSASGIADWISTYGRLDDGGNVNQGLYEIGQNRMGSSIWEIPDGYIKDSPIFKLDKVTTPLLIMHTKKDGRCSFDDAIEFFTGLRRLGKKAWMLAYSEGDHGVGGKEADDFSIRMMQFFDHYLKDEPVPLWMLNGESAEAGLELDTKGRTPGSGLLTPIEQAKVDSLMTRKPITLTLK